MKQEVKTLFVSKIFIKNKSYTVGKWFGNLEILDNTTNQVCVLMREVLRECQPSKTISRFIVDMILFILQLQRVS